MTRITEENAVDFLGAEVRFNYGPRFQTETGTVFDFNTNQWGTSLLVEVEDGSTKAVNSFVETGIGCYLVKKPTPNPKSPWYIPATEGNMNNG